MISKATSSFVQSLKQKKFRQKYNKFLLEGEKIILEGLEEGIISFDTLYGLPEKEHLLQDIKINYNIIDTKSMSKLSNLKSPPGLLAVCNIPSSTTLESKDLHGVTLYLDDIKDPGNMGTIIRTADWFGVKNIVASEESVEFYNPKVLQASMGSFARVRLSNLNLESLNTSIPIYATALEGKDIKQFAPPEDLIVVIGSESHGVSPKILDLSAQKLTIPKNPNSKAESLNAGIATAIVLSHLNA